MISTFNLKLRSPKGLVSLDNVSPSSTLSEFKIEISKRTSIPAYALVIKAGYPPKNIAQSPDSTLISTFDISSGDMLIIEQNLNLPRPESEKDQKVNLSQIPDQQTPNKDGLIMIRRIIPADNSCLFHAVAYNLNPKSKNFNAEESRQIVAGYIMSEPQKYEGLLEKTPEVYAEWIMKESSWGGEVELDILAKHFDVEICAINIQTCQSLFYGKGQKRMFVLYDGIHYDSVVRNICDEIKENDQTLFEKGDSEALDGAIILGNSLRKMKQFTDLTNFSIQCNVCFQGLKGEKEVVEHTKLTGHSNFVEINKQ